MPIISSTFKHRSQQLQRWIWILAISAVVISIGLAGLHIYQKQKLNRSNELLHTLDRAEHNFATGYSHFTLSNGTPNSPWKRDEGLQLLKDAFHGYEQVIREVSTFGANPFGKLHFSLANDAEIVPVLNQLQQHVHTLHEFIDANPDINSGNSRALHLAFFQMTQSATDVELWMRERLDNALSYQDRVFYTALLIALILLTVVFVLTWMAEHERNARDQEWEEQAVRFVQLTETISDVFWLTDTTKNIMLYISPAYEQIWGRSCDVLYERPEMWLEAIHIDDRAGIIAALNRQAEGGYREEYRILRPDGSQRWIEDRAFPIRNEQGEVYRIAGLATDITHRKYIEARLRASEGQLRQAARIARLGAWSIDAVTHKINLTAEVCEVLDLLPGSTMSLTAGLAMYPPRWRTVISNAVKRCLEDGVPYDEELQIITASGRYIWARTLGEAVRDGQGNIIRLDGTFQDITEQKHTVGLLAQGGQRFHQLANALPIVIWSATPNGIIDYTNNRFGIYTGLNTERILLQQDWMKALHPDDRHSTETAWRNATREGDVYITEFRIRRADGVYRWHLARAVPITNEKNEIIRWHGSAIDIHDTKLSEEKAVAMAERLAATLESITDAFFTLDTDWTFTYVNQEAEHLLHRKREDILGKSVWAEFPEIVDSEFDSFYREAVVRRQKSSLEAFYSPLNSWFSINAYPSAEGLAVYFQDVTQKHLREEQLRLLEACVAHMNDMVVITDANPLGDVEPRIVYVNPAFERLMGYRKDEVLGQSLRLLRGTDSDTKELERVREALNLCQPVRAELVNITKAEQEIWVEMDLVPITDGKGKNIHWIAVERDITERKRIAELEQAHQVAELSSQAKSSFLAAMSHEIRTPINGVIGMLDVLEQTNLRGHQLEMVDIIRDSATSLLGIIEDILDFSKIEAGKLILESIPFAPAVVTKNVCLMLDRMALSQGVEVTLFTDPALPTLVKGDELRLRQILINLLNNAIKFSGNRATQGHVAIRLYLVAQDEQKTEIEFRIRDDGIGMTEQTLARLFSPFVQADISTTRHFGGTGLGLSITNNLVRMMQGTINVASLPGEGSEFRIRIPFLAAASASPFATKEHLNGLTCILVNQGGALVDDLTAYLAAAGVELTVVNIVDVKSLVITPSENTLWIIDIGAENFNDDSLTIYLSTLAPASALWLVVGRGQRRKARFTATNVTQIDGNLLDGISFLTAVAQATGRVGMDERKHPAPTRRQVFIPPRGAALQQGRLILVAEDNSTNQKVINHQLGLLGYAADIVSDGEQALTRWRHIPYALILTDLHMPEVDGYELARFIRAAEHEKGTAPIPIIALTANALQGEAERCLAVGMNAYLTKPIKLTLLEQTLAEWMPAETVDIDTDETDTYETDTYETETYDTETGFSLPVPAAAQASVDVNILAGLIGNDEALLMEFLQDFSISATTLATEIVTACERRDMIRVASQAHMLKSSARAVGAKRLGEICEQMETSAKYGNTMEVMSLKNSFESELTIVIDFISVYLTNR